MPTDIQAINEMVRQESAFVEKVLTEMQKVIVGQRGLLDRLMIGVLCQGHILLEGVPGLAKTLSVKTFADTMEAVFRRIQFTPDLLPADLIGTMIYNQKDGKFYARKGPVFANIILADEINRAPAKVQSALLESMQERQVTISEHTYPLPDPFLVLATQNPIEQEGTYPLPEAQVDRFMLKVTVGYPTREEERRILDRMTGTKTPTASRVTDTAEIIRARDAVTHVYIDDRIKDYIVNVVQATRHPQEYHLDIAQLVSYGASPRATVYLSMAARAHAFIKGRGYVTPEDIKAIGPDVLRHRLIPTYEAEAEEVTPEDLVRRVFDAVEVP